MTPTDTDSDDNRSSMKDLNSGVDSTATVNGPVSKSSEEILISEVGYQPIDDETLQMLGENLNADICKDMTLHPTLVDKWNGWLTDGLKKDDKASLLVKYPRVGDCNLEGQKLNPEVMSSIIETSVKRDKHFVNSQNMIGSAMAALGSGITALLNDAQEPVDKKVLLEYFWDSGKLLAAAHFQERMARKAFIVPGFDKKVQNILNEAKPDTWLFGADLAERIKSAKTIEKVGLELKPQTQGFKPRKSLNQVNWRGPSVKNQGMNQVGRNNNTNKERYRGQVGQSNNRFQSQRGKTFQPYQRLAQAVRYPEKNQQQKF